MKHEAGGPEGGPVRKGGQARKDREKGAAMGYPLVTSICVCRTSDIAQAMASKAVEGEQKGGKYPAEKEPVKAKAEKKPVMEGNKKKKAKSIKYQGS